jgi:hypothetical protein
MKRYLFCLLCLPAIWTCRAQEEETNNYLKLAGAWATLYSGKEEAQYPGVREHPYLDTQAYREGNLWVDGRLYPAVKMRLNVYADELSVRSPDNRFGVVVSAERIDSAGFPQYDVFYDDRGFSVRLHNGKYPVWKRQTKQIERVANGMKYEQVFTSRTRFYVYKDGRYQNADSKRSLLKVFAERKKELNAYVRQQQLNWKEDPAGAILRLVKYYESLNP